jgi:DNA-binding beta-propeller fold protein YncE
VVRWFFGLTHGTYGEVKQYVILNGQETMVPAAAAQPPTINASGQGASTSSASGQSGAELAHLVTRAATTSAPATITRTIYMPDAFTSSILILNGTTLAKMGQITPATLPYDVVASPDGSTLYAALSPPKGSTSGSIAVISTASQTITSTIPLPANSYPQWEAISPDGTMLYVAGNQADYTGNGQNYLRVIDLASGAVKASLGSAPVFNSAIARPIVSPDGLSIYQPTVSGLWVYAATGKVAGSIALPGTSPDLADLAISQDGSVLVAADGDSGNLYQINTATNSIVATFPPPSGETANTGTLQLQSVR